MAEILLTMAVGPLLSMVKEKASSYLLDQYQVMEGMEEQHEVLKRKLPAIIDVMADAEEQAANHREGAKAWLEAVRKVAYKANDALDEFKYEALRRKAKEEGHYKKLGMDVIKLFPTHNRVAFRDRMANKLRIILQEIDVLIAEMNAFKFKFKPQAPMPMKWWQSDDCIPMDSVDIASKSRAQEKKDLVDRLLAQASSKDLTVLPIVGMGGLGKTTLARLVYSDPQIKKHFKLRLWVCVSDNFNVDSLADKIVKEAAKNGYRATASPENAHHVTGNSAQDQLQNAVREKRYLLVLDDVWNHDEHKWEKLKSYLQHGSSGSSVLTTTRNEAVAKVMMGTIEGSHEIKRLDTYFIEEIIKTRAFGSGTQMPTHLLRMIGDVTKICSGSPLLATALGSLLRTKTTKGDWKDVLCKLSNCDEDDKISRVLKLSYSGFMKQCFAFCAMFPKGHEIDVEMLIQLWMANGFIPDKQGEHPEIIGTNIFVELASTTWFQDRKGTPFQFNHTDSRVTCKIHDLMHDAAMNSMGNECATIATKLSKSEDFPYSARHLFLSVDEPETILNTSLKKRSPAFQTLICNGDVKDDMKILARYNSIRALKINRGSTLRPKYLQHLRYLDLSRSEIKALPKDISILYLLQTLNLSYCQNLERLPKQLKYLTLLRHLYTHGCSKLKSMPPELGHLTSLQMLTCFVAGTDSSCSNVRELEKLDHLGGKLELCQLENVTEEDAQAAGLGNKKKLTELKLRWTDCYKEAQNNNHEKVVEGLKPHDGLKVLRIHFCGSRAGPTWINKLEVMVELQLSDCKNIKMLPPLWQLPALQVLQLCRLDSLHCLCSGDTPFKFQELKELTLSELPNFKTWVNGTYEVHEEQLIFPRLEKLLIYMCKMLPAIPNARDGNVWRSVFPVLTELEWNDLGIHQEPMTDQVLATMVVGPLVSTVKEQASSYLLDQYQVMEGMEEQHKLLKRKLPALLDVIADAEEQAAKHRAGAKAWLEQVRTVAYKANDVLDEFKYEALRRKAKAEGHYKELGMDVIKLFPSHSRVVFRCKMAKGLCMILQEIDVLIAEMNAFTFKFKPQPQVPMKWRQTDAPIPTESLGIASESRAKEKEELVNRLLSRGSSKDLTVLPIVGMGGLGKTTLAQLIYNDPKIQKHFELRFWVCVSDDFDVDSLADKMVEENGYGASGSSALDRLQNAVSGKRCLLVLDDVWNRDEPGKWGRLKSYLQHGGSGSSVLTTTRDEAVAKLMMGTTEGAYNLGSLDEEYIEKIIKAKAFGSKQEKEWPGELVKMVGEVAKRCAGSPLAATALGSVLRTKTTEEEWESVLRRSSICDEENKVLPVLRLIYNDLPSHMRQCFAFCAMFPKDYVIDVEMLIQLWMANGFIPEKQGERPEITGKNIFVELASRSFFQDVEGIPFQFNNKEDPRVTCKIHDLMHDVAQSAMGEECAAIATHPTGEGEDALGSVRHLYLSIHRPETLLNTSVEKGSPAFQTLICDGYVTGDLKILSKYNSMRALKISGGSFLLRPKYLHHLRYLDLSKSGIKGFPEDISILYHLQTLNLSRCFKLERLPKQLKYLTALRHLYTHQCWRLKSMPVELGTITSLQTLTSFVAGTGSDCCNVRELWNLDDLGGNLELRKLENVTGADAQAAGLGNKKRLTKLELWWTHSDGQEAQNNNHNEVLEGLKPHDGLKALRIYNCRSSTFPAWLSTVSGMVELVLYCCKELEKLPALWQELPALQILHLEELESFQCLCSGGTTSVTFPELKVLTLVNMENFEAWWETHEVQGEEPMFPKVEELEIKECKSLTALPKAAPVISGGDTECRSAFPALRKMTLQGLRVFERWEAGEGISVEEVTFPRLEELSIGWCDRLCALPKGFPALKKLELSFLPRLEKWGPVKRTLGEEVTLPQLENLTIRGCPTLTDLPEAPRLSVLSIEGGRGGQLISLEAAGRYIPSLSRLNLYVPRDDTERTLLYVREKWNDVTLPLPAMTLYECDLFFSSHSSALALWTCFARLVYLDIYYCDALDCWPENVFQILICLRKLRIEGCSELTGRTQAPQRGRILPLLESLRISGCESLVEVPNLPASLKELRIHRCSKLESIVFGQQEDTRLVSGEGVVQPDTSSLIPARSNSEATTSRLESLEHLELYNCGRLVTLPDGPQAYSSLRVLHIKDCDGIKLLPPSLQSRLNHLDVKVIDDRFEEPPEPKTLTYAIKRMVHKAGKDCPCVR